MIRPVVATIVGFVSTFLLFQVAAVLQFVAVFGTPMGASPPPPSVRYLAVLLVLAALVAAGGGALTRWMAREARWPVVVVALALAALALWGFSRTGSRWPLWWSPVLAVVAALGSLGGGMRRGGMIRGGMLHRGMVRRQ